MEFAGRWKVSPRGNSIIMEVVVGKNDKRVWKNPSDISRVDTAPSTCSACPLNSKIGPFQCSGAWWDREGILHPPELTVGENTPSEIWTLTTCGAKITARETYEDAILEKAR